MKMMLKKMDTNAINANSFLLFNTNLGRSFNLQGNDFTSLIHRNGIAVNTRPTNPTEKAIVIALN